VCISSTGPSPRTDAGLVFDAMRNVLVLYGGRAGGQAFRDTWEFRGTHWVRRDSLGPTPEPHGVAAFDPAEGGVLLFAGLGDDTPARRTWLWNGTTWTARADEPSGQFPNAAFDGSVAVPPRLMTTRRLGPGKHNPVVYVWRNAWNPLVVDGDLPVFSPQAPAAATHDGAVLYAGFEADRSVSTWTLRGSRWAKHAGPSPGRRKGARMAYDAARDIVVLHAGDDGDRVLDDTWEWDGRAWRRVP
jgi:hypothetical protein